MKNPRNLILALISLVFLSLTPVLSADVPAAWQGLWELTQETAEGPVRTFLWLPVGKGQAELFGANWKPLVLSTWSVQGDSISVNLQASGVNTVLLGNRKGNVLAGTWKVQHPQFQVNGALRGRLIHSIPNWTPLSFSLLPDQRTDVLDWAAEARKSKAEGKLADFNARYFALFGRILPTSLIDQTIETNSFKEKNAEVKAILEDVLRKFSDAYRGASLPLDVVLVPNGEAHASVFIQDRQFVVINPEKFTLPSDPARKGIRAARTLFEHSLNSRFPPAETPQFLYTKAALSLAWTQALGYTSDPASILLVEPAAYESAHARLADLKLDIRRGKALGALEFQVVALALGEFLGRSSLPTRDSTFDPDTIRSLFGKFLLATD